VPLDVLAKHGLSAQAAVAEVRGEEAAAGAAAPARTQAQAPTDRAARLSAAIFDVATLANAYVEDARALVAARRVPQAALPALLVATPTAAYLARLQRARFAWQATPWPGGWGALDAWAGASGAGPEEAREDVSVVGVQARGDLRKGLWLLELLGRLVATTVRGGI
jgi:hypothetical protein